MYMLATGMAYWEKWWSRLKLIKRIGQTPQIFFVAISDNVQHLFEHSLTL